MKMPREIAPQFVFFRMTVPAPAYSCSAPISQNQCLGVSNDGNVLYLVILSFLWGFFHGNLSAVAAAALDGAQSALELSLSMAGILCLWSGVMEILNVCGLSRRIAALFRPLLRRLLPNASRDEETLAAVSANVSANLLGLGNAATPLGIQAARRMARNCGGAASDELCLLVVLNTASIQLLPTTVASVRAAFGSAAPFDILPAVWISSLASVTVGLLTARLLSRRKGGPA